MKSSFDRATHCRKIASSGGKATVAKYGSTHMSKIGKRGATVLWERYRLVPVAVSQFALVHKATGKVVSIQPGRVRTPTD